MPFTTNFLLLSDLLFLPLYELNLVHSDTLIDNKYLNVSFSCFILQLNLTYTLNVTYSNTLPILFVKELLAEKNISNEIILYFHKSMLYILMFQWSQNFY